MFLHAFGPTFREWFEELYVTMTVTETTDNYSSAMTIAASIVDLAV